MKKYVIILVGLVLSVMVFGQNETKMVGIEEVQVTPPIFKGIENVGATLEVNNSLLIRNFLLEKSIYPVEAFGGFSEGTEIVQFTVNLQGMVTNIEVINSVSTSIDNELIRVLKTTNGMWNPGYKNGEPTAMEQEVTVVFGDNKDGKIANHFISQATINFKQGGKNLLVKNKPEKALRYYSQGMKYMPNDKSLLLMRGMCYYELGDTEKAKTDWNRIVTLGGIDSNDIAKDLLGMTGYLEMTNILAKNKD